MEFILSCCSPADLTNEHLSSLKIPYIPFHYMIGNQELIDDLGQTLPYDEFYQAMIDGADTKTMQVNIEEYTSYFNELLSQGLPILHVTLSGGLSGTANSA
ncbi:MAG: DegV family protein, partial [Clostridia bacterium]|nr:DegV family protein [Clostridia bacterium]